MKTARSSRYFQSKKKEKDKKPIKNPKEIIDHPDPKIDQDFPGFPHGTARKELIRPVTGQQKKTAAVDVTDGEKMSDEEKEKINEQQSDGSASAFRDK